MEKQSIAKKIVGLILGLFMLTGLAVPAIASSPDISVYMDGRRINFEVPPQMIGGRTMLPLRAIFEEMGAEVAWDAATQTATATRGNITVVLPVGSLSPTVNGVVVPIDQAGVIVGGRTFAPLRFVAEAFGGEVQWDGAASTAHITTQPFYTNMIFNEMLRLGYTFEQAQNIFEQEMFTLFNEWRVTNGLAPFQLDVRFAGTSRNHAHNVSINRTELDAGNISLVEFDQRTMSSFGDAVRAGILGTGYPWRLGTLNDPVHWPINDTSTPRLAADMRLN